MQELTQKVPRIMLEAIITVSMLVLISFIRNMSIPAFNDMNTISNMNAGSNYSLSQSPKPILQITSSIVDKNSIFNWKDYVVAYDRDGNNITNDVIAYGTVNTSEKGAYDVKFIVKSHGLVANKRATFIVD